MCMSVYVKVCVCLRLNNGWSYDINYKLTGSNILKFKTTMVLVGFLRILRSKQNTSRVEIEYEIPKIHKETGKLQ